MHRVLSWILEVLFVGWIVACVGLGFLGWYRWLFMCVAVPFVVVLGYIGLILVFRPRARALRSWHPFSTTKDSYPTVKERALFSLLFLGSSLVLLVFVILDLLGALGTMEPVEEVSYIIVLTLRLNGETIKRGF